VTVLLGAWIVYLAAKAFRVSRTRSMFWLTVGMATLTFSAIAEGLAFRGAGLSLDQAHVVEGVFTLLGFAILVWSLHR